jgi:hypothetical protein
MECRGNSTALPGVDASGNMLNHARLVFTLQFPKNLCLDNTFPRPYITGTASQERGVDRHGVWCSRQPDHSKRNDPAHQRGP